VPELSFQVRGAEAVSDAALPAIALQLEISNQPADESIQTVVLRCQIQIEAPRRQYGELEKQKLRDIFAEPERWRQTLRPITWANVAAAVPGFTGTTTVALQVPCTFDFNVSSTKYFHALDSGDVPLTLLFSGTVFYYSAEGRLQAAPISWNSEARFRLPVRVWRECLDRFYPNVAWLCLRRDVFERLYDFKVGAGLGTFDDAIESILEARAEAGR